MTLWYDRKADKPREPLVAELSFKIDGPTSDTKTLDRAESLFLEILNLPWADPHASTKSSFVHQYRKFRQ